jgi:hypothetical protein
VLDCFNPPHPDFHVCARPEPVDDRHKAVDGEPPEVRIAMREKLDAAMPVLSRAVRTLRPISARYL